VTTHLIAPERNSIKLRQIRQQVVHKVPASFQAATTGSHWRDDIVEELATRKNTFS
jgi:hypothetical protein